MQERVINRALSGEEIRTAILKETSDLMAKDCRLASHVAYGAFSYELSIKIKFQDAGSNVQGTNIQAAGTTVFDPELPVEELTIAASVAERAPNEVRVQTGQGVPVLAKGPGGRVEEKKITYAPKKKA
jgi:hypothetical protein